MRYITVVVFAFFAMSGCNLGESERICEPGRVQQCPCLSGQGIQICREDGLIWEECQCTQVQIPQSPPTIQIGITPNMSFSRDCATGDWQTVSITFPQPFPSTPRVFICGKSGIAVVWQARDVTENGFTAAGRNSDCASGPASAQWVAIAQDRQ